MLLYHNFIRSYASLLKYGKVIPYFPITPIEWNELDKRLHLQSSIRTWKCKICASFMMLCGLETIRHIFLNDGIYTNFTDVCFASFTATCFISMAHLLWELGSRADQIKHYINGMIEIEQEYLRDGITVPFDNYTKVAFYVSEILAILAKAVPLLFGFASGFDPKFPANTLSFAFRRCLQYQFFMEHSVLLSFISLITNIFMYYLICFTGALFGSHFFISFATARTLLICVLRSVDKAQATYSLTKGIYPTLKKHRLQLSLSQKVQQSIQLGYRKMQLLWNEFNQIHSPFLVNFVLVNGIVQIMSACFLIKVSRRSTSTQQDIGFFPCLLALMATVDAICIILGILSSSAEVHSTSIQVKKMLKQHQRTRMMRGVLITKIIQSLPEVRTKFGLSNFIDKLTPLKFQNFNINRIVDLLLCGNCHTK